MPQVDTGPAADRWGHARDGESPEQWYARETKTANAPLVGTRFEGSGRPSDQAARAYEQIYWNKELKAGRDAFAAEQARVAAVAEGERQQALTEARRLKAEHDKRKEEADLLAWAAGQRNQRPPGRV